MKGSILFLDNDPPFMRTRTIFLEREGYTVYQAKTVVEAEALLKRHWIQLLLIDVRLTDNNNMRDRGGLEFAARADIRNIPKLIITAYPNFGDMRQAMSRLEDEPVALDYIDKAQPAKEMVELVDRVFEKQAKEIGSAILTWSGLSAAQVLLHLLDDDHCLHFKERQNELEVLFRSAFRENYREIIIMALPAGPNRLQRLIIHAFPKHAQPITFASYCAAAPEIHRIEALSKNFKMVFPEEVNALQAFTSRFALFAHPLEHFGEHMSVSTFSQLFGQFDADFLDKTVQRLQEKRLKKLHGQIKYINSDLSQYFPDVTWETLQQQKMKLESAAGHMGLNSWFLEDVPGMRDVWEQMQAKSPSDFWCGVVHGNLSGQTIVFNPNNRVWVLDFLTVSTDTPLVIEYARLECNLRSEWSTDLHCDQWKAFEQALLGAAEISDELPTAGRLRKQMAIINSIRNLAWQETKCEQNDYDHVLVLCLAERIMTFDTAPTRLPHDLKPYLSSVISLYNLLATKRTEPSELGPDLKFDKSRNLILVDGEGIELTASEADLLEYLKDRRNQLVTRAEISQDLYGVDPNNMDKGDAEFLEYQRINTMIMRLRKRLEDHPRVSGELIRTIRGRGYILVWPDEA
jgi:DNA-binding response OmpR family regulator